MMRLDYTLTLPGMFDIDKMQTLANELNVEILAKVIFTFTPDIIMSPLALPRDLLDRKVDQAVSKFKLGNALHDVLLQLTKRPTMQETFGEEQYQLGMRKGKQRILDLERIRSDRYTMTDILSADQEILKWWRDIDAG